MHLHAKTIRKIVSIIENSPCPIYFYKVKAHSGVIGNEGADACARTAAHMETTDITLPAAKDPFHNTFWLSFQQTSVGYAGPPNASSPFYLTNLKDKLKTHMHSRHKLGSADTSGCFYQSWHKLNNTTQPIVLDSNPNAGNSRSSLSLPTPK